MASYDSDSSSEDGHDFQTNVTLGFVTEEPTGDDISHVGGHPSWLDPATKPAASLAQCKVCNGYMSLLLQLQADLQQHFPHDERRLFVWCCRKKQCSKKQGSLRAFREVKKAKISRRAPSEKQETRTVTPTAQQNLGNELFGGSAALSSSNTTRNPFSTSTTTTTSTNSNLTPSVPISSTPNGPRFSELAAKIPQPPTHTFADELKISSSSSSSEPSSGSALSDPWPPESSFPSPLPHFYLDAESEYLDPSPTPPSASQPSSSHIPDPDDPATTSTSEKDLYESPHDKAFDTFTRILSQNPEQILRYEFKGMPLLYSSTDSVATRFVLPGHTLHHGSQVRTSGPVKGIPTCQYCGSVRVFECQLVPHLIYELEKDNEEALKIDGKEGMEWGTIIVGTCSRNCGDEVDGKVVFREEWVGVQWEEGGVELKQRR